MTPDPASHDGRMISLLLSVPVAVVVVVGLVFAIAWRFF